MANQTGMERDAKFLMKGREQKNGNGIDKELARLKKENLEIIERRKKEAELEEVRKQNTALKHPKRTAFIQGVSRFGSAVGTEAGKVGRNILKAGKKELKK